MARTLHGFGELLKRVRVADGGASAYMPEDWTQGRSMFGGLPTAVTLRAMRAYVDESRRPRSLLVSFVGPVEVGWVEIEVNELRKGRAVTHLEARLIQNGSVRCVVLGSFGSDRESGISVPSPPRPHAAGPEGLAELTFLPGVTPTFTQHVAFRWTIGAEPFTGVEASEVGGWCRFREQVRPTTEEWVLALVDAWPAPIIPMFDKPTPTSSLSWTIEFVQLDPNASVDDWWFFHSIADNAAAGYVHAHAALWDPAGRLAALGRQVITVFG